MSAMKILGIVLIAGGILGLVYGGFSYTKESHEAKIGPITLSVTEKDRGQCPDVGRDRRHRGRRTDPRARQQEGLVR